MAVPALSVQLFSVRDALDADLDETFARLAALGFRNVEAFDFVRRAPELAAALSRHGLASPTAHARLAPAPGDAKADAPERVLDAAVELGAGIVFEPMVQPDRWADAGEVRRTADQLNAAAALAAERGLAVGYHNHSQEFHHDIEGLTAYEYFASQLDDGVQLELDAYWATVGGQDVPALLARLGDRVTALHVKDGSVDYDPFRGGEFDPARLGQVPAGTGAVPVATILDSAPSVRFAVVEYDAYAGDIFDGIAGSVAFLAERGIR